MGCNCKPSTAGTEYDALCEDARSNIARMSGVVDRTVRHSGNLEAPREVALGQGTRKTGEAVPPEGGSAEGR